MTDKNLLDWKMFLQLSHLHCYLSTVAILAEAVHGHAVPVVANELAGVGVGGAGGGPGLGAVDVAVVVVLAGVRGVRGVGLPPPPGNSGPV